MMETLQQDEIDALLLSIKSGEEIDTQKLMAEDSNEKRLRAACQKLIHCYEIDAPLHEVEQARGHVHWCAHLLWLKKKQMTREEYILFVRRLLEERGLVWCPWNPPGQKLMKKEDKPWA